jgi:hypothetical protein
MRTNADPAGSMQAVLGGLSFPSVNVRVSELTIEDDADGQLDSGHNLLGGIFAAKQ